MNALASGPACHSSPACILQDRPENAWLDGSLAVYRFSAPAGIAAVYASKGALRRHLASRAGQGGGDEDWLSDRERAALGKLRDGSRRDDWRLGRWLAKQLVVASRFDNSRDGEVPWQLRETWPSSELKRIEILPRTKDGLSNRPQFVVDGTISRTTVSLSHTTAGVVAGLAFGGQCAVGVDLVHQTPPTSGFLKLWFCDREQAWLALRPDLAMLAWGVKEAAYKAVQTGERFVPTAFEVNLDRGDIHECRHLESGKLIAVDTQQVAAKAWAILAHHVPDSLPTDYSRDGVSP